MATYIISDVSSDYDVLEQVFAEAAQGAGIADSIDLIEEEGMIAVEDTETHPMGLGPLGGRTPESLGVFKVSVTFNEDQARRLSEARYGLTPDKPAGYRKLDM